MLSFSANFGNSVKRVIGKADSNILTVYKAKMHGVVRTCAFGEASKTGKPDNKRITILFQLSFMRCLIGCQSFTRLDLHPAGLEPATL